MKDKYVFSMRYEYKIVILKFLVYLKCHKEYFPKKLKIVFFFFCNCAIFIGMFFVGFTCLNKKDTHFILIFYLLVFSSKHFCEVGGSNFIIPL